MLAYFSDMTLLDATLFAHGRSIFEPDLQVASLDQDGQGVAERLRGRLGEEVPGRDQPLVARQSLPEPCGRVLEHEDAGVYAIDSGSAARDHTPA